MRPFGAISLIVCYFQFFSVNYGFESDSADSISLPDTPLSKGLHLAEFLRLSGSKLSRRSCGDFMMRSGTMSPKSLFKRSTTDLCASAADSNGKIRFSKWRIIVIIILTFSGVDFKAIHFQNSFQLLRKSFERGRKCAFP